jgi:hypothetical protein
VRTVRVSDLGTNPSSLLIPQSPEGLLKPGASACGLPNALPGRAS